MAKTSMRRLKAGAASLLVLGFTARASAEQFVVGEATYTHSAQTTKDSHFYVNPTPETPDNWASPVDYANGSVHVRLEVKTKPSDAPTRYQICFEMNQNYCCTDQAPPYTEPGIYEWDTDVVDMWRPGPVDFTQGIRRSSLILKDTTNVKPAPENVGEETSKLYMPTDLSVTVTVVRAGDTFMPPEDPQMPGGGTGGGGAGGTAGGMSAGSGGAAAGSESGGSGGAPVVMMPEPIAGTAPSVPGPMGGTAGTASAAPMSGTTAGDDASCAVHRAPSDGRAVLLALLGLLGPAVGRRTRQARRSSHLGVRARCK
jgi:hypothetical protein